MLSALDTMTMPCEVDSCNLAATVTLLNSDATLISDVTRTTQGQEDAAVISPLASSDNVQCFESRMWSDVTDASYATGLAIMAASAGSTHDLPSTTHLATSSGLCALFPESLLAIVI